MSDDHQKRTDEFGRDNVAMKFDDDGVLLIRVDTKRTIARAGDIKNNGKARPADLVATNAECSDSGTCAST